MGLNTCKSLVYSLTMILLLLNQSKLIETQEKYWCKTQTDIKKLNKTGVDRMLLHDGLIYLFLKDQIINFKMPFLYREKDWIDENRLNVFLITNQAFVLQKPRSEPVNPNVRVFGGIIDSTTKDNDLTFEYLLDESTNKLIVHNVLFGDDFGKYGDENALTEILKLKVVEQRRFSNKKSYDFVYRFHNPILRISIESRLDSTVLQVKIEKKTLSQNFDKNYTTKSMAFYYKKGSFPNKNDNKLLQTSFIELDTTNHIMISYMNEDTFKIEIKFSNDLVDFFGCFTKFRRKSDVKGIYFNGLKYFIFVHHYYIMCDEDLVNKNFSIPDKDYENGEIVDIDTNRFFFEDYSTKWIKDLNPISRFVILDQCFEMRPENGKIEFYPVIESKKDENDQNFNETIVHCLKQTLRISKHVFCFNELEYFFLAEMEIKPRVPTDKKEKQDQVIVKKANNLKKEYFRISELFKKTGIDYNETQRLEFIFDYKQTQFVFMTEQNLYLIDYDLMILESKDGHFKLSINETSPKKVIQLRNAFYDSIDTGDDPIGPTTNPIEPTKSGSKFWQRLELIFISFVVIGSVLLIIHLVVDRVKKATRNSKNKTYKARDSNEKLVADKNKSQSKEKDKDQPSLNFNLLKETKLKQPSKSLKDRKEESQSGKTYDKQIQASKLTTINLNKFIKSQPDSRKSEKSDSARITYINSEEGLALNQPINGSRNDSELIPFKQSKTISKK